MRNVVGLVMMVVLGCASAPAPAGVQPAAEQVRLDDCEVRGSYTQQSQITISSLAACRAGAEARRLHLSKETMTGDLRPTVVEVLGPREWHQLQRAFDDAETLLSICYRRWYRRRSPDRLAVVATFSSAGAVRSVRTEREDGLGRCVVKVLATMELPAHGFDGGSTEVLATLSYRPSHWTRWALR